MVVVVAVVVVQEVLVVVFVRVPEEHWREVWLVQLRKTLVDKNRAAPYWRAGQFDSAIQEMADSTQSLKTTRAYFVLKYQPV